MSGWERSGSIGSQWERAPATGLRSAVADYGRRYWATQSDHPKLPSSRCRAARRGPASRPADTEVLRPEGSLLRRTNENGAGEVLWLRWGIRSRSEVGHAERRKSSNLRIAHRPLPSGGRPAGGWGNVPKLPTMTVLAISPHPDDVEIGCFGTLARLAAHEPVVIVVLTSGSVRGAPEEREREALESAQLIGASVEFLRYSDGSLVQNAENVGRVRDLMKQHRATTVFAPYSEDTHQDHAAAYGMVVASAVHTGEILLYETPSTIEFRPDVFYDITSTLAVKQRALALFHSQADRAYLDATLVEGQARYFALRLHQKGKAFEAFALYRSVR